jgi:hypothetical protein
MEMLEDLHISEDATGEEGAPMMEWFYFQSFQNKLHSADIIFYIFIKDIHI